MNVCKITIYTNTGAIDYIVHKTCDDYIELISNALSNGDTIILNTIDNTTLLIQTSNIIAIEFTDDNEETIPPT